VILGYEVIDLIGHDHANSAYNSGSFLLGGLCMLLMTRAGSIGKEECRPELMLLTPCRIHKTPFVLHMQLGNVTTCRAKAMCFCCIRISAKSPYDEKKGLLLELKGEHIGKIL
jgi:hypothetical protein